MRPFWKVLWLWAQTVLEERSCDSDDDCRGKLTFIKRVCGVNGVCVRSCERDRDCGFVDGIRVCTTGGQCLIACNEEEDAFCPRRREELCVDGVCLTGCCLDDSDCDENQTCQAIQCITTPCCPGLCSDGDICALPKVVGPCEAAKPRWFFNAETGMCEEFIYGGCEGNANNFLTLVECRKQCDSCQSDDDCEVNEVCDVQVQCETTSCPPQCIPIQNENRCNEDSDCEENEVCEVEQCVVGCRTDDDCGENEECYQVTCITAPCPAQCINICSLPKDVGPCFDAFSHWYFDQSTRQCTYFVYGGCKGNGNNFENYADCRKQCDSCVFDEDCEPDEICDSEECVVGCRVDEDCGKNQKCLATPCPLAPCPPNCGPCVPQCIDIDICSLPKDVGYCDGLCPKYFFNTEERECEIFYYGCCGGNENNFETLEECQRECDSCEKDSDCSDGEVCEFNGKVEQCVAGCRTDDDCGENQVCQEVVVCIRAPCPPICANL